MLHHQSPYFASIANSQFILILRFLVPLVFHICALILPINSNTPLECAFLGYSSHHKGYLCLDIHSDRVFISCHVIFNEDFFPFQNLSSSHSPSISFSSSLSVPLSIPLSLSSLSLPTSPSIPHSFSFFSSTSSTCSRLVALISFFFSHYVFPFVPPSSPLPPFSVVDLLVPSMNTDLLVSYRTHNIILW